MTGPDGVEVRPNAPDLTMDEAERAAASLPDGLLVVQRGGRTVSAVSYTHLTLPTNREV